VDRWLAGTAHDRVVNVTSDTGKGYGRANGSVRRVSPPAEQTFWLATAAGVDPLTLNWQADNGDFALVLANADGTPAVAGAVKVATQLPNLTALGSGLRGSTAALLLVGFWLTYLGASRIGRRHHALPNDPPSAPAGREPTPALARSG
jgi:hypothetical protein